MSRTKKVDDLKYEHEVAVLDKKIVETELKLFRFQLFAKLQSLNSNSELVRVVRLFIKLFYYYLDEAVASEENVLLKEELSINNELITKYETEYDTLLQKHMELQKKFNVLDALKSGMDDQRQKLKKENFRLKQLEEKYSQKVKEEFSQKLLQFKLEEYQFLSQLLSSTNKSIWAFVGKISETINLGYFFEFLFRIKKVVSSFKIMYLNLKSEKDAQFYLGYFISLLKILELNVTAAEFESKVTKNPINKEIFLKMIGDSEELFRIFKERKEKIEKAKMKLFYYSLHRLKKVFYPNEKNGCNPPNEDGEVVPLKASTCIISHSVLEYLVNSVALYKEKGKINHDSNDSYNSFKNIIGLFVGTLAKTKNEFQMLKKQNQSTGERKSYKSYFVLKEFSELLELFYYVEEDRKFVVLTNSKNNRLFNLLYKVKQKKFLKVTSQKTPTLEYTQFVKSYNQMLDENSQLDGLKKNIEAKEKDLITMNRIVTNLKVEKKEMNKKLVAVQDEIDKRKKNDEEKISKLNTEIENMKGLAREMDEKKKEKVFMLKQEILKLKSKEQLCEKLQRKIKKLQKKKKFADFNGDGDNLSSLNMNQNIHRTLEKRFGWIHNKIEEKERVNEIKWLKSLNNTKSSELRKLNKMKEKIKSWKVREKKMQLKKKIVDFKDSKAEYDKIRNERVENKNKLNEIKNEIDSF